jgi:hypothetical protein
VELRNFTLHVLIIWDDQTKQYEMDDIYSMHGLMEHGTKLWLGNLKGSNHLEDLRLGTWEDNVTINYKKT